LTAQTGTRWGGEDSWSLTGNAGTNSSTHFLGTTDAQPLAFRTNNEQRMIISEAGGVGIGVTTPTQLFEVSTAGLSSPTYSLDLTNVANGVWTTLVSDTSLLDISPEALRLNRSGIRVDPPTVRFDGANSIKSGIVEANSAVIIGSLKRAYWIYQCDDAYINVLRVEFRLNNNALEVQANTGRWRHGNGVAEGNQTDAYFSGSGWTGYANYRLSLVSVNSQVGSTFVVSNMKRVGIGTNAPTVPLDVNGQARIRTLNSATAGTVSLVAATASGVLQIVDSGSFNWSLTGNAGTNSNTFLGTTDAQPLAFRTNNEQRMIVDATGNVGIGTTSSPTFPFEITIPGGVNSTIEVNSVPADNTWTTLVSNTTLVSSATTGSYIRPQAIRFGSSPSFTGMGIVLNFSGANNNSTDGVVEADGSVLIDGLKSSYWIYKADATWIRAIRVEFRLNESALEVREQAARYRSTTDTANPVPVSNQTDAYFSGSGWTNSIYSFDIVRVGFYDNLLPTLVAREDKVGIGTASPTERLDVDGQARVRTLNSATAGTVSVVVATTSGVLQSISSEQLLTGVTANVGIGTAAPDQTLSVNGNASKVGGGSWATFSDQRVKTDITPYRKGLMELLQINPVQYRYNELSGYDDTRTQHVGVLAQEIEQILPSTVTTFDDSDGPSGLSDKRQFDPSELLWTTINAIKELKAKNDSLQVENEALKARLKRIEAVLGIE